MTIESQIIKSKKEIKLRYYAKDHEILDLDLHSKQLKEYNEFCQNNLRQNEWRKKYTIQNGSIVPRR